MRRWLTTGLGLAVLACAPLPVEPQPEPARYGGVFVHGSPRLRLSYPEAWRERHARQPDQILRASAHGNLPSISVYVTRVRGALTVQDSIEAARPILAAELGDASLLRDVRAELRDGTPAREGLFRVELPSGTEVGTVALSAFKGKRWVLVFVSDAAGSDRETLRRVAYTLRLK